MSFGSATWECISLKKGEITIVIKGDTNDVDTLTKWFEDHNIVKSKEEYDGQMIMTFDGKLKMNFPQKVSEIDEGNEGNEEFGDATWGLIPSHPGESGVVIQGKNEDDVHNLANWFLAKNTRSEESRVGKECRSRW